MRGTIFTTIAILFLGGGAMAQTATAAMPPAATTKTKKANPAIAPVPAAASPAKPAVAMPAKPAMAAASPRAPAAAGRKPMTPESKACSAQADTQGLHGKDREKFRRACLKGK